MASYEGSGSQISDSDRAIGAEHNGLNIKTKKKRSENKKNGQRAGVDLFCFLNLPGPYNAYIHNAKVLRDTEENRKTFNNKKKVFRKHKPKLFELNYDGNQSISWDAGNPRLPTWWLMSVNKNEISIDYEITLFSNVKNVKCTVEVRWNVTVNIYYYKRHEKDIMNVKKPTIYYFENGDQDIYSEETSFVISKERREAIPKDARAYILAEKGSFTLNDSSVIGEKSNNLIGKRVFDIKVGKELDTYDEAMSGSDTLVLKCSGKIAVTVSVYR